MEERVAPPRAPDPGSQRDLLDWSVLLTSIGNRAYTIAVVAYVYGVTHSAGPVAAAAALRYLSGLGGSLLVFPLAKRIPPRRMLFVANALCGLSLLAISLAIHADASVVLVIALTSLVRAATMPIPSATAALLPQVLGGKDLAAAAGRQNAIDKLALLAGPAVGGVLLFVVSPALEVVLVAALFVAAVGLCTRLPDIRAQTRVRPAPRSKRAPAVAPWAPQVGPVGTALFAALSIVAGFLYGIDTVAFEVIAQDRYHLGNSGYGLLFAGLGAGGLVATFAVNRLAARRNLAVPIFVALWLYAAPTALIPLVHTSGVAVAIEAVRGAGALVLDFLAVTALQRILLPRRVPVVVSAITAGVSGSVAAGALLTPLMLDHLGLAHTLVLTALVFPVLSLPFLPRLIAVDKKLQRRAVQLAPRTRILARLPLMAGTSRPTLEMLASQLTEEDASPGTKVVTEGSPSDDFYVVVSGAVEVSALGHREAPEHLATLGPGTWFGEIAALTGTPRSATVTVTEPTRLLRIDALDFRSALEQLPPSAALIDGAVARLHEANEHRSLPGFE